MFVIVPDLALHRGSAAGLGLWYHTMRAQGYPANIKPSDFYTGPYVSVE